MDLVPGTEVERYVVISRIGAGQMSTTYAIRHTVLDTLHALLVPNQPIKGLLARLVSGAKIQARLRHPGIISATDVLDIDGMPGLVLDHVEGPSLEQFVASHDLDEAAIDALANGLCEGVAWLQSNSVVHRHLKPRNIIVDVGREVVTPRITDFTLARVIGETEAIKRQKKARVFGTPAFMSPEQSIDSDMVDHRADIWSLGCILYYLCTGRSPFEGPDAEATFTSVRAGLYEPLRKVLPSAPSRWCEAIAETLVVEPDMRAQNAAEVADRWFEGAKERPKMSAKTAPVGQVTLVFTDIQGSTRIWETQPEVARHSLRAHDAVMRSALHRHGGYEVKTEGDAFMVAFSHPERAIGFCLEVQRTLHGHPWSPNLIALPEAEEATGFRGLRVRMGVHVGEPEARAHGTHVDYYGPMVNRAARIASAGHGGQILVSGEAWALGQRRLKEDVVASSLGTFLLRGLEGAQEIVQVLPASLAQRTFPAIKAEPA